MQARKNARKFNADEALNASGSWVNPKSCASIPKKAGKGQVHANGQSASRWYTSPDGRKVSSDPICTNLFFKSQSCPSQVKFILWHDLDANLLVL